MFTTNDNKDFADCFSLFDSIKSTNYELDSTKIFLTNKFIISFDEISKNIADNTKNATNIIDIIYDSVNAYAYGYSLNTFCKSTYMEYSHGNSLLAPKHPLLEKCNEQIKYHCLISSLYTVLAISYKDSYRKYFDIATDYSGKEYLTFDKNGRLSRSFYSGFERNNDTVEVNIRSAYDTLSNHFKNKPIDDNNEMNSFPFIFTDRYLKNAFNYKFDNIRLINSFLEDFSFDLIINQMKGGFDIPSKIRTLCKYRRNHSTYFRRETKRFMEKLKIIDKNFFPFKSSNENSLLYYWKRESLFHINIFKYLINTKEEEMLLKHASNLLAFPTLVSFNSFTSLFEEILHMKDKANDLTFIIKYFSEITFPVYTYTFFISLCEYFNYSLVDIKNELSNYLNNSSIKIESSDTLSLNTDSIVNKGVDSLGEAILDTFSINIKSPHFDNSFYININNLGSSQIPIYLKQSSIGLAYYLNILR